MPLSGYHCIRDLRCRGVDRWNANPIANAVTEEDLAAPGPIIYGQVVQLYHGLSDTWLGVRRRVQSAAEKSSFQVGRPGRRAPIPRCRRLAKPSEWVTPVPSALLVCWQAEGS